MKKAASVPDAANPAAVLNTKVVNYRELDELLYGYFSFNSPSMFEIMVALRETSLRMIRLINARDCVGKVHSKLSKTIITYLHKMKLSKKFRSS